MERQTCFLGLLYVIGKQMVVDSPLSIDERQTCFLGLLDVIGKQMVVDSPLSIDERQTCFLGLLADRSDSLPSNNKAVSKPGSAWICIIEVDWNHS
jgi:hypothetical protein